MKDIINKGLIIIGYFLLWTSISGFYSFLQKGESIENVLSSLSIALPLGLIFRWFSLSERFRIERVIVIVNDVLSMLLIRGVIGLTAHFMLPSEYFFIITEPLFYGTIFIITGVIGLLVLKVFRKRMSLKREYLDTIYDTNKKVVEEADFKNDFLKIEKPSQNVEELFNNGSFSNDNIDEQGLKNTKQKTKYGYPIKNKSTIIIVPLLIIIISLSAILFFQINKTNELNEGLRKEIQEIITEKAKLENEINRMKADELRISMENLQYKGKANFMDEHIGFVNKSSSKYHLLDCEDFDSSSFGAYNKENAEAIGYYPCPKCH